MYKAKVKIWIFFIIIAILLSNLSSVKNIFPFLQKTFSNWKTTEYTTYVDVNEFSFITKLDGYKKKHAKINVVTNTNLEYDVIIKESSNEEIEGFTKYEKQFYSPIVMFVPNDIYSDSKNTGFIKNKIESSLSIYYYYQKDLKILLEAVENDLTYEELGIDEDIFGKEQKVKFAIPDKNSECYEYVIQLMGLALCDYDYTKYETKEIQDRLTSIIKKCDKYEDAGQYIQSIIDDYKKAEKTIVLAPEYICINNGYVNTTGVTNAYMICIPTKTINFYYDLYVKNIENMDYYNKLFNSLENKKFIKTVGLRNKERDFMIYKVTNFSYTVNNIPAIN